MQRLIIIITVGSSVAFYGVAGIEAFLRIVAAFALR